MAIRTNPDVVRELIETDEEVDIKPFIRTASLMTDQIANRDTDGLLSSDLLIEIEAWLAAHFYAQRDMSYKERVEGKASGVFQGETGMMLSSTLHGQTAIMLDVTGYLSSLNSEAQKAGKFRVGAYWLGKPYVSQRTSRDRGGRV